jgi:hypothetical protein
MEFATLKRRRLLQWSGLVGAAALSSLRPSVVAAAALENQRAGTWASFTESEAAVVEAFTARIIPTTTTPGAREAGAVWFIDAALQKPIGEDALPLVREGVRQLNEGAAGDFAAASDSAQDASIQAMENSPAFSVLHFLTIAGTFTLSRHGGNRDETGWDLLGFQRRHHWSPPFGYYDTEAANGETPE